LKMNAIKPFRISGTGCALVDYLYKPVDFSGINFTRYLSKRGGDGGLSPGKLVFTEEFEKFCREKYLQVRDSITKGMNPVAVNIGGPSIVSLIHTAQMLYGTTSEVCYYGSNGKDEAGRFIIDNLRKTPLKVVHYKTGDKNTPFTDVLCDPYYDRGNGERVFINNIGAAWDFFPEDLDDTFFNSDIVIFGGTALVPHIHSSLGSLLKKAKQHKALTIVNTVYDFLSEKSDPVKPWKLGESAETYQYIDLMIADMEEALRLSGTTTINNAIDFFTEAGVGAMIITHGSNQLNFFADSNMFGKIAPATLPVSERVTAELRQNGGKEGDTTGCGDNLAGGVVASIARQIINKPGKQINLYIALAMGIASGGYTCFYHGGTFYEEYSGQKQHIIESYYQMYIKQENIPEEK
jgi:sugar/nucleoside kinase (ribokinase family)